MATDFEGRRQVQRDLLLGLKVLDCARFQMDVAEQNCGFGGEDGLFGAGECRRRRCRMAVEPPIILGTFLAMELDTAPGQGAHLGRMGVGQGDLKPKKEMRVIRKKKSGDQRGNRLGQ